eukprot:CAMPEP_0116856840 /NCGR_PEP_ID=MMETSP0418-20121206/20168_1 /TAXON_ID=1158023 /ORGANISM="Astrosyne radiata, Strain 13vi08-1A" /LENGTH=162 /DNA_ID=CAMNT_0004490351 /DNA_START=21 /DNA_END=505 /DNA_ORIENTATION=+
MVAGPVFRFQAGCLVRGGAKTVTFLSGERRKSRGGRGFSPMSDGGRHLESFVCKATLPPWTWHLGIPVWVFGMGTFLCGWGARYRSTQKRGVTAHTFPPTIRRVSFLPLPEQAYSDKNGGYPLGLPWNTTRLVALSSLISGEMSLAHFGSAFSGSATFPMRR